jgi:hypothetical protein
VSEDIEERLARLKPARVPTEFEASLKAIPTARRHVIPWVFAGAAPLAAAALWLLVLRPGEHPTAPAVSPSDFRVFVPVERNSILVRVEELGVVEPTPERTVRLMRAVWLDETTYRGEDGHTTIRRNQPRAEIIPVHLKAL